MSSRWPAHNLSVAKSPALQVAIVRCCRFLPARPLLSGIFAFAFTSAAVFMSQGRRNWCQLCCKLDSNRTPSELVAIELRAFGAHNHTKLSTVQLFSLCSAQNKPQPNVSDVIVQLIDDDCWLCV